MREKRGTRYEREDMREKSGTRYKRERPDILIEC